MCLDNPDVQALAQTFLVALVEHYRNHPALFGYDLWNEGTSFGGNPRRMYCYCEGTKRKLREWLRVRYGSLESAARQWHRYSYQTWDDVEPPRYFSGYPDSLDWLQFRIDNAYSLFDWRVKLFRKLDPKHRITAHGVAGTLDQPAFRLPQRMAVGGGSRYLGIDLDRGPEGRRAMEAISGSGPGSRRSAGQAVLACGSARRSAVDAASGDRRGASMTGAFPTPKMCASGTWSPVPRGAKGILYCRVAAAARWASVRRLRPLRHGRLAHAARRDGGASRAMGEQPSGDLEIEPDQGRHRTGLCPRVGAIQLRATGRHRFLFSVGARSVSGFFRFQHSAGLCALWTISANTKSSICPIP